MRHAIACGLTLLLWASTPGRLGADEPKPLTPAAERYRELVKAQSEAGQRFYKAWAAAKTDEERERVSKEQGAKASVDHYLGQFLALIRERPLDPAAFDAFLWMDGNSFFGSECDQAADVLAEHWAGEEGLAGLCQSLAGRFSPPAKKLLRSAIDTSPHRAVQGQARLSLGLALCREADNLAKLQPEVRKPYEQEAEKLLQEVVDKYADVKAAPTLGKAAATELFVLRHLAVGKTAPEIDGVDLDGKPMKLSDFRGKVVLLTFTGTWSGKLSSDLPREKAVLKRLAGRPFAVVGVNTDDDRAAARKVYADQGVPWRSFANAGTDGPIGRKWNIRDQTLYLLDAKGVIRYKGDYLQMTSARTGKDGKTEQYWLLDVAVDALMAEMAATKP